MNGDLMGRPDNGPGDGSVVRGHPILILTNPTCLAARGLSEDALVALMADVGLDATVEFLVRDLEPEVFRRQLSAFGGPTVVVAAGGDGTVHHVVNLLAGTGVPLGVLPLGTANDFARSLQIPIDLGEAARLIADESPLAIDLGSVNGHLFLNAAHLGLGVETAKRMNLSLKRTLGAVAYVVAAFQAWRVQRPVSIEVCADGQCARLLASQLLVGNGRFFGGGNLVAKDATLDDGLFDVNVLAPALGAREALRMAAALRFGRLGELPETLHFRTARLTARLSRPTEVNLDGEVVRLPEHLAFEVMPRALSVYARSTAAVPALDPERLVTESSA